MHPVEALWSIHQPPTGYPAGVVPVPEPIRGLAFFPGGYGLWGARRNQPLPAFPVGGTMVLGHDFHSEEGYRISHGSNGERLTLPTWRNLIQLLDAAGIAMDRCFFTNLYMGLRAGSASTGLFPGARDAEFVAHCKRLLLRQIDTQRPSLILTLGVHVPPVIGHLSPELAEWAQRRGLKHLDAVGPARDGVTFGGVENFRTSVVALIHPSLRHASLRHRRYGALTGNAAELAMMHSVVSARARPT